jgi:hypothetical protein
MSLRKADGLLISRTVLAACALLAALPTAAQYPGQVSKNAKESPELRSIAVLEWTGDKGNPTASRLVPVAVLDAGQLQDGGIYLARPEPLALVPEVEYELQQDGQPLGLFDIRNAGQVDGSWVGFGAWKPMPSAKPRPSAKDLAKTDFDDDDTKSDTPVLHRKHHNDDSPSGSAGSGSGSGGDGSTQTEPSDPDRPVLRKKSSTDSTSSPTASSGNPPASTGAGTPAPGSSTDSTGSNGPVLHKKDAGSDTGQSGSETSNSSTGDPDRPAMKKGKPSQPADRGGAESAVGDSDPDRPRLKRGKSSGDDIEVAPSLKGFPPDVQQVVAVSDSKSRPAHPWNYAWSNPDDEAKLKSSLEDMARDALGLNPLPAKPAPKRVAPAKKSTKPAPPPPPAPLEGEQFRVFELAYGSGATLVLSAHTSGAQAQQKFVTLVAQPDLYGNVLMLLKNVTDGAHLDEKPRMRLVDAVDAMADNRGELLFELRGASQRQFALFRVLRGRAEKLFVTGGGEFGAVSSE